MKPNSTFIIKGLPRNLESHVRLWRVGFRRNLRVSGEAIEGL